MRIAPVVTITEEQARQLQALARGRSVEVRLAQRAQMILLAAQGMTDQAIAAELNVGRRTPARWRQRFLEQGLVGIERDAPRPGRKRQISAAKVRHVIAKTTRETPPHATHWSTRTMAAAAAISEASVRRIWHANGLKPHLFKAFKISNDKRFAEKLEDIVGLYLNPPEHALVLCCDEKSQIQALDRTQPGLPLKKGRAQTLTHDYKRNGTTTLFAALNMLDGAVIGQCLPRHRHQEWLKFLRQVERETPSELDLHLIVDNYATHNHPKVKAWVERRPRFHLHFTPTSASWLNMVERFFRDLSQNAIKRGVFPNVPELISVIQAYVEHHNRNPKPFIWTARASDILAKVVKARARLNKLQTV